MTPGERYIPVTELPSTAESLPEDHLTWDFSLPPSIDAERLVIDSRRFERVLGVAAFRAVHVKEYQGETSSFTPNIAGINVDGTAVAAKAGQANMAETQQASQLDDYSLGELMEYHGKTRAAAILNKPEIVSRVVDRKRDKAVSSEQAWAHEINNALSASLRTSARKHLIDREEDPLRKYFQRSLYGYYAATTGIDTLQHEISTTPLVYLVVGAAFVALTERRALLIAGEPMIKERRWSLTPLNPEQWDRYVAVHALTRTMPLIKART